MSNLSFVFLSISFAALYGVYVTMGAVVSLLTGAFGYNASDNAIFGAIFIVSGVLGSFMHAMILDKFKKLKLQLLILCVGSVGSIILFYFTIDSKSFSIMGASLFLLGIFVLPIIGHGYSYASEIALPVGESLACGILLIVGSVYSTVMTFVVAS